jgi:hypothetical protein
VPSAPPALVNAVVDALGELGIEHLDMPLTPGGSGRRSTPPNGGRRHDADYLEMLDIVCRTAVDARRAILKVYAEEFDVRHKADKTLVTE